MYDARENTLEAVKLIRLVKEDRPDDVDRLCVKEYGGVFIVYNPAEEKQYG
jgi:hypothetical protein